MSALDERSKIITQKIEELTKLAELEGEPNVQIVMLALSGARQVFHDGLLAGKVQEFLRDVLMPEIKRGMNEKRAQQN